MGSTSHQDISERLAKMEVKLANIEDSCAQMTAHIAWVTYLYTHFYREPLEYLSSSWGLAKRIAV